MQLDFLDVRYKMVREMSNTVKPDVNKLLCIYVGMYIMYRHALSLGRFHCINLELI